MPSRTIATSKAVALLFGLNPQGLEAMMKFPYGIADFYKIIKNNYFYIDRTAYIRLLEEIGDTLLFLRPRRFGKSLLLSVLENYYDVNKAAEFEALFGHLAIGQNPTALHNHYLVMRWDFSAVLTQGDERDLRHALHSHINGYVMDFALRYKDLLLQEINIQPDDAIASFAHALSVAHASHYQVYLMIDEYDNFANAVLMAEGDDNEKRYRALIQGEGMLKVIFQAIKVGTQGRGLDRVFITGVSPIVMSDVTSGFNISRNISLQPELNQVCGFWEEEIEQILTQLGAQCGWQPDQVEDALMFMRTFYNGYNFTYDPPNGERKIYNPTLALYFLSHVQQSCHYPRQVLDENLAMDSAKIAYISQLPQGQAVIAQALDEAAPLSIIELANRFGVEEMLKKVHDTTFMVSLLYYLGVLTLSPQRTEQGKLIFKIPNLVIRKLYVEKLYEQRLPDLTTRTAAQQVVEAFYQAGDMALLCQFIEQHQLTVFDNRDYRWTNELTIKTVFMMLLFNDTFYIMDSEPALLREYGDLVMMVRPDMRQFALLDFLMEFKYIELGKHNLSGEQVKAMSEQELRALPIVKKQFRLARAKLKGYRQVLVQLYGAKLHLRSYAVVAVGYERLLWVEV